MANKYIYLTSENFIKSNSTINDNIDNKYLQSAMRESQEINLQSLIGTRLLRKLQNLVKTNEIENSGNTIYKECVDQCQYFLLYHTVAKLVMITGIHISNFGPNSPSDENMDKVYFSELGNVEQYWVNKADHYGLMLQNWLLENRNSLPELCKKKVSELHSNLYSAASCGLFLGGARGRGWGVTYHNYLNETTPDEPETIFLNK